MTTGPAKKRGLGVVAQSASWLLSERVLKLGVGFVATVWVARYLGPEAYGVLALAISFSLLFSELTTLGLNALLVRFFIERADQAGRVMGTAIALRLVAGVLAGGAAVLTVWVLYPSDGRLLVMVGVLVASFLFRAGEVFEHYFHAVQDMRRPAMARMTSSLLHLVASAAFILFGFHVAWFALAKALETATMNAALAFAYVRRGQPQRWSFDSRVARSMLTLSWPLILSGFGATLNLRVDQVMLASLASKQMVGLYAAAAQLSEVWYFVPTAIMTATLPVLMRLKQADATRYRVRYQATFDGMLWLGIGVATLVSLTAGFVVPLLFGEQFVGAVPMLIIHVWGGVFVSMRAVLSKWIVTEGMTMVSLVTHGLGAAINVGANLLLIPAYGGIGAAIATVISYATSSYLALFLWRATWPAARMMSSAWFAPVRLLAGRWKGYGP